MLSNDTRQYLIEIFGKWELCIKRAFDIITALTFLRLSTDLPCRCLDHFLESDTDLHAYESLVDILNDPASMDILLVPIPFLVLSPSYTPSIPRRNRIDKDPSNLTQDIGMLISHRFVKFPRPLPSKHTPQWYC
jgi:hypothetical protein